ncbi:MAG TPA: L,D-transpeptidase family protein [Candidatus Subteraquimicrobiales bacterium]
MKKKTRRKILFLASIVLFLFLAGWGSIYGFADRFVKFVPKEDSFLPVGAPTISAKWERIPGVKLVRARIVLDGEDISSRGSLSTTGFIYKSLAALEEGKHTLKVTLDYRFLLVRHLKRTWNFTTDTIPPGITLKGSVDGLIGTAKPQFDLAGATEPRAKLRVSFKGRQIPKVKLDPEGRFALNLKTDSKSNKLKMSTVDRAGNRYHQVLSVIYDKAPPEIVTLNPAPNTIVRTQKPELVAKLNEPDSVIRSAILKIDGKTVATSYDPQNQTLLFVPQVFFDGTHSAALEVVDAAGNKNFKEWVFTVDTSHIRISLAQRRLFFHKGGQLLGTYPVAVGLPQFPTPQGNFRIIRKRKNPAWVNPGADWAQSMPDKIPPGPDNPLGQRALDLSAPGIRIHGTPSIGSIGRAASHGCVRMYPWNIEVLFDQVGVGTPVEISLQ